MPTLESITTTALSLALDAASLRQQAIAANIANHASEGYVPQKVEFESLLADARSTLEQQGSISSASLEGVQVRMQPMLDANGLPVRIELDAQMADMAQNAVQYQTLTRALARHFSILSTAASDGKR